MSNSADHGVAKGRTAPTTLFPRIGVVTPVRNRRHWSVQFAKRFREQDYPLFVLYIVDSASTDGTREEIRALGADEIVVLNASASSYWTGATNVGVRQALNDGCDYVLTLNDDAVVAKDYLSCLVEATVRADERIVGSVILFADKPATVWGVGAYNDWKTGNFLQTGMAYFSEEKLTRTGTGPLLPVDYLCGNGTLVHRSVFDAIGFYNIKYAPHYHSDTELTMRAERAGISRWVAREARVYNRFNETNEGAFSAKNLRFFSLRSANYIRPVLYIIQAYCPPEQRAVALVRYLARYLEGFSLRQRHQLLQVIHYLSLRAQSSISIQNFFPPVEPDLSIAQAFDLLLETEPRSFVIGAYAYLLRRSCTDEELAAYEHALMSGRPRAELLREFITGGEYEVLAGSAIRYALALIDSKCRGITPLQQAIVDWRSARGRSPGSLRCIKSSYQEPKDTDVGSRIVVYFNIDVACMAVSDKRAKTGVYRYVVSILKALMSDRRLDLKTFCSMELRHNLSGLYAERPEWRRFEWDQTTLPEAASVVFYPYFPTGQKPAKLRFFPQCLTVCDLFPLTRPEWFSADAVTNFRVQLRNLGVMNHVFCISQSTEGDLKALFPTLPGRTSVAHLASDYGVPHRTPAQPRRLGRLLQRAFGKRARRYFLCVGTIEPRKNLRNVIEAFRQLAADDLGVEMIVAGQEGWAITKQELMKIAGDQGRHIHFMGRPGDEELRDLYAGAICTVFPSLGEGFGLPIVESFSCGTPVITSNNTSMAEIATKGALLVDPLRPDEIAAALHSLIVDRSLRDRLGRDALDKASEFSWKRCAEKHVEVFTEVAYSPHLATSGPDR